MAIMATTAKASLTSNRSTSATLQPARASAFFSYMCGILSAGGAVAAAIR